MTTAIQVVTTIDTEEGATRLARTLVERRLAACVQVAGPVASVYRWQGRVEEAREWQCLIKTRADLFDAVAAAIRALHAYELPEIIALPIVAGGTVVNYVFVMIRIDLSSAANSNALRAKEPYFRDALVRAAHRAPFNSNKDYLSVDEAKLKAQVMRDAVAIAGARNIKGVTLISQTAKRHSGVPKYRGA